MRFSSPSYHLGAICIAVVVLALSNGLKAQPTTELARENPPVPVPPGQVELTESFRQLQRQLHAAEQAIVNNRLEAEAAANAHAAALAEKLDALKQTVMIDRERLQIETQRTAFERLQQQTVTQDLTRVVILLGGAGLLTLFAIAALQWRSNRRMAEYAAQLQMLPAPSRPALLPVNGGESEPGRERVAQANERLLSVVSRMERRVQELEQTTAPSAPSPTVTLDARRTVAPRPTSTAGKAAQIKALLEQGQSFLNADKPVVALACYDEILSLDENHAEALHRKGTALERLQKFDAALQFYDRAIEADHTLALAYIAKGGLLVRLERFEAAFECYEQAIRAGKTGNISGVSRVNVPADWPAKR